MSARRRRLVFDEAAIEDLLSLADYIADIAGLPRTANGFIDRIEARCQRLPDFPFAGRDASDLVPGLRIVPFESVLIAYKVEEGTVRVLRILGRGRDFARQFGPD